MSRSGDRQKRLNLISLVTALTLSVAALGSSAFLFAQNMELQQKISAISPVGGVCGPAGADGEDGADGICGPVGATGPCGPVGPEGEQGEPGAQGEQGETGATGAQGEKGETGATGAQGEQGEQGETGATGAQGPAGADGVTTLGHHGSFWDTEDQFMSSSSAQAMRLNSFEPTNCGVYVSTDTLTRIYVTRAGTYNLQFSAQIKTTSNQTKPVDIWLSKNGSAVPDSNTQFFAPDRRGIYIAAWNFVVPLQAGEYLELMWYSADSNLYLSQLDEQTDLGIPAVPSLILTLTQVG